MATNYYKELFLADGQSEDFIFSQSFSSMSNDEFATLNRQVTIEEISQMLHSILAFKAPDKDVFQDIFYQSQYTIVGESFVQMIKDIFANHFQVTKVKETQITFILKVESIVNMKVTKNLAQHLCCVLETLVVYFKTTSFLIRKLVIM